MNCALFGLGNSGKAHLQALLKLKFISKILIYEKKNILINKKNNKFKNKIFKLDDLTKIKYCDFAIISLPNNLHAYFIRVISKIKKIPILCEKPFTGLSNQAQSLIRLTNNRSIVGYNYSYNPIFIRAKKILKKNKFGKIILFHGKFFKSSGLKKTKTWKDTTANVKISGASFDLMSHLISLFFNINKLNNFKKLKILNIKGKKNSKLGNYINKKKPKNTKDVQAWLSFKINNGPKFFGEVSKIKKKNETITQIELFCEKGYMKINFTKGIITYKINNRIIKNIKIYSKFNDPINEVTGWLESFYNMIKYWLLNLDSHTKKKNLVNFLDAIKYIKILNKIENN